MNLYQVKVSRKVIKSIEKLPKTIISKVYGKISSLATDSRPSGSVKLKGFKNYWRIRVGDYRIIYSIEDQIKIVKVRKVADRKDVY